MLNIIIQLLINIILIIIATIIHEYGHYFAAKILKLNPILNLRKLYVKAKIPNMNKFFLVLISGVIIGFIPCLFITDNFFILVYMLGCIFDLINIVRIIYYKLNIIEPSCLSTFESVLTKMNHEINCKCNRCVGNNTNFGYGFEE